MVDTNFESNADPPRRVLLVDSAFPALSQTFIANQFLRMLDRGWDIHVRAIKRETTDLDFYPEIRDNRELRERFKFTPDLSQSISRLRPDLVHFEFGHYSIGHLRPLKQRGIRSVV